MRLIDADALIKQLEDMAEESRPIATARPMKDCTPAETVRMGVAKALISWLKETPTVNPWISVKDKDRLPKEYESVITYDKYSGVRENWLLRSEPIVSWSQGFHVTHWMPKPKPPKEEKHND